MSSHAYRHRFRSCHDVTVFALKYIPIAWTVMLTIHVALLLNGRAFPHIEMFADSSLGGLILLLCGSYAFGFCRLHRACIFYDWAVSICIDINRDFGFGGYLQEARIAMLVCGLCLIVMFIKLKVSNLSLTNSIHYESHHSLHPQRHLHLFRCSKQG